MRYQLVKFDGPRTAKKFASRPLDRLARPLHYTLSVPAATGAGKIGTVGCRPQVRLIDGGQATTMVARRRQTRWRKIDTMPSISPHSREHCYRRAGPTSRVSRRKKMGLKFDPPASGPRPMKLVRNLRDSRLAPSDIRPDAAGRKRGTISAAQALHKFLTAAIDEVQSARAVFVASNPVGAGARRCGSKILQCVCQLGRIPVLRQLDRRAAQYSNISFRN